MGSRVSDFGFRVLGLSFTDLGLGCLVQGLGFVFGFGGLGLRVRFPMISSVGCTIKSETRNSISGAHDFSVNRDLFFFL